MSTVCASRSAYKPSGFFCSYEYVISEIASRWHCVCKCCVDTSGSICDDGTVAGVRELREIERLRALRTEVDAEIADAVRLARSRGATWDQIAEALDISSRQGAYQWFQRQAQREGI
jgi:hypothetical protein